MVCKYAVECLLPSERLGPTNRQVNVMASGRELAYDRLVGQKRTEMLYRKENAHFSCDYGTWSGSPLRQTRNACTRILL